MNNFLLVIKKLFAQSGLYAIATALQSAVGFLLLPLYTRFLTPTEYGQLEILNTLGFVVLVIALMGFNSALVKVYFRDLHKEAERKSLVATAAISVLAASVFLAVVMLLGRALWAQWLFGSVSIENEWLFILLATYVPLMAVAQVGLAVLRVQERAGRYALVSAVKFVSVALLSLALVWYFDFGLLGAVVANGVSFLLLALAISRDLARAGSFSFSKKSFVLLATFGWPLIPAALAMWVMDISDRYVIQHFLGLEAVGVYSLGYKFGFLINIALVAPFQLAWPMIYFKKGDSESANIFYKKVFWSFLLLAVAAAAVVWGVSGPIIRWFADPTYWAAVAVVPLVAFAYVFFGLHYIAVVPLHLYNKNHWYPVVVVVVAVMNVVLNWIFVPTYGIMAAAVTTLVSFVAMLFATWLLSVLISLKQNEQPRNII